LRFVSAKISWRDCTRISIGCCRRRRRRSVGGGKITKEWSSPLLFKERLIYEQSAARTVREQQGKRSCDRSRQPLKIAQSHCGGRSAELEDSTPRPRRLSLPRCPLRVSPAAAECAPSSPFPASNHACRDRPASRRRARAGFTRSSTTASASWHTSGGAACA
jgi:hypothetical protein